MAFSSGKESISITPVRRYLGVAAMRFAAINPTKEELEVLRGYQLNREVSYMSKGQSADGREVDVLRLDIYLKTTDDDLNKVNGTLVNVTLPLTIYLRNQFVYGNTSGKYQVVDSYGRFAWITKDHLDAHTVPANIRLDTDYRQAYVGEEDLTKFCKALLGIEEIGYVDREGQYHVNPNPDKCKARLDHIADYFTGNIDELKATLQLQPNNKCKVLLGVREDAANNRSYQTVYPHHFLKFGNNSYNALEKNLDNNRPYIKDTVYQVCSLKEYSVQPTNFESEITGAQAPETTDMLNW